MASNTKSPSSIYTMGGAIIALAFIAALIFVIKPQFSARSADATEAETVRNQTQSLLQTVADLEAKSAEIPSAVEELRSLISAFPNELLQSEWLRTLRADAAQAGVAVSSVTVGSPMDPAKAAVQGNGAPAPAPQPADGTAPQPAASGSFPLAQVDVAIAITGTRESVEAFMVRLQTSPRPVILDSITLSGGNETTVTTTLTGRTYLSRPLVIPDI